MSEQIAVRETLQNNRPLGLGVAIVLIVAAIGLAMQIRRPGYNDGNLTRLYYSDDDGKTYFSAEVSLIPPFDHDGRRAYQAMVFRNPGGQPFVGYLLGYTDAGARRLGELYAAPHTLGTDNEIARIRDQSLIVKRPGEAAWHPIFSPEAMTAMAPVITAGKTGGLEPVNPD